MNPEGVMIYLADHVDDGRLPRRDVGVTSPADQHHQASAPAPS
jgi:hypothetical protein